MAMVGHCRCCDVFHSALRSAPAIMLIGSMPLAPPCTPAPGSPTQSIRHIHSVASAGEAAGRRGFQRRRLGRRCQVRDDRDPERVCAQDAYQDAEVCDRLVYVRSASNVVRYGAKSEEDETVG
jgi:hypothetical protein